MSNSRISRRIQALSASQTLAMSQKSRELRAKGIDVINLSVGEPDFPTPEHIKEAAKRAIDENYTHYTPVPGYMELRRAIADTLRREHGVEYAPEQIVVSGGAKQALSNAVLALVNEGDEVVIPVPAWVSYVEMVKLAGGINVTVPAGIDQDFKVTPAQLEAAITPATRLVMLCSPSNPSGAVYSMDELRGLVEVLARHPQVMVLADEIYEHINYTGSCLAERVPGNRRPPGACQRSVEGLCHDRLAYRLPCRSARCGQGREQAPGADHLGLLLHSPEGSRSGL